MSLGKTVRWTDRQSHLRVDKSGATLIIFNFVRLARCESGRGSGPVQALTSRVVGRCTLIAVWAANLRYFNPNRETEIYVPDLLH